MTVPDPRRVDELDQHLPAAVELLGWDGQLVGPLRVFGRRIVTCARLLTGVHTHRVAASLTPVIDKTEAAIWAWPEMRHRIPPPAVQLVGVIAPGRHWRTARMSVAPFTGMCPTAVLLPREVARRACVPDCTYAGRDMGVVVVDEHGAVDVWRNRPVVFDHAPTEVLERWVLELVYDRLCWSAQTTEVPRG